jgi:L-alanine-DL-glutamate epimerase-like enolase superfamily enzyme
MTTTDRCRRLDVAVATPHLRHLEWFSDHARIECRFLEPFPEPRDGYVVPEESPGHGPTLSETALAPYGVA